MIKPDYSASLVNLISSVIGYCGGKPYHEGLPAFDSFVRKCGRDGSYPARPKWKNVLIMLYDGMGVDALEHFLEPGSFLRSNLVSPITSVFPPTTTAATTSVESGLTPAEHGWLGWTLYVPELQYNVALFPNVVQDTGTVAADYKVALKTMPYKPVYDVIKEGGEYDALSVSKFGTVKARAKKQYYSELKKVCAEPGNKYIYGYQEYPDDLMHLMGTYSRPVDATVKSINRNLRNFCRELAQNEESRNTLVIVTADHGHIPIKNVILDEVPEIRKMMLRPVSIEPRACSFFIKSEYLKAFPEAFNSHFKDSFVLYSKEEILKENMFGNLGSDRLHPTFLNSSLGDYIAVATGDTALVNSRKSNRFRSHHAGATREEMLVPFIAIDINTLH